MNKKYIVIDSSKENALGTSCNFKYLLSENVVFKGLKLLYCAIPFSSYLIDWTNDTFSIKFNDNTIKNITITHCDYDTNSLATTINTLVNYSNFTMSFDQWLYKYKISASQNFQILNGTINALLGFNDGQISNLNNATAINIVDFLNDTLFYIKINNYYNNLIQDNNFSYTFVIPNTASKYEICYYFNNINFNNEIIFDYEQVENSLEICIYDLNNQKFDNNGLPIQMILLIEE